MSTIEQIADRSFVQGAFTVFIYYPFSLPLPRSNAEHILVESSAVSAYELREEFYNPRHEQLPAS